MNCLENHLSDIVRMEIYPDAQCTFPVPSNVSVQSMSLVADAISGPPVAVFALSPEDGEFTMTDMPTAKVTDARQPAGVIYTHDIQLSVAIQRAEAIKVLETLYLNDFHVIYTRDDNSKWLSRSLPNTSVCNTENTDSSKSVLNIKIKMSSMSSLIALT